MKLLVAGALLLLAGSPLANAGDLESSYQELQAAVAKSDAAAVKKLAAETSALARSAAQEEPAGDSDKEDCAARVARAKDIDHYTEYALAAVALRGEPAVTVELLAALEAQNPASTYLEDAYPAYFAALIKTGAGARVIPVSEAALKAQPANADVLLVLADNAWSARRYERSAALATRLVAALNRKTKPEGVAAAAWTARKNEMLGRGYWIAGLSHAARNEFFDADKCLRAALPLLPATNEEMVGAALFNLGLADYHLGRQALNRQLLIDAANYSERAAKMKTPYAQQAWTNAHLIRSELERVRR
jgi:hypothetical protein